MRVVIHWQWLGFLVVFGAMFGAHSAVAAGLRAQVAVKLLGQQCLLIGPVQYSKASLLATHGIGPAQVNPNLSFPESIAIQSEIRKQKDYLVTVKSTLPPLPLLENYRAQLEKRLKAQVDLLALVANKKQWEAGLHPALEPFIARIPQHLMSKNIQQWTRWSEKIQQWIKGGTESADFLTQLFHFYNAAITPDPQGDFYLALDRADIEYSCTLER